jgi:hypothetical protein
MNKTSSQIADIVLEKEAGIREAIRFLGTGRSTARHGTSGTIAKSIRREGVVPRKSKGIVDVFDDLGLPDPTQGKDLAFFSRGGKKNVIPYARQQGFIEETGGSPLTWGMEVGEGLRDIMDSGLSMATVREKVIPLVKDKGGTFIRGARAGNKASKEGLLEMRYPARKFKPQTNPEMDVVRKKFDDLASYLPDELPPVSKSLVRGLGNVQANLAFRDTFGLASKYPGAAAMPAKYIRGSKAYQPVTLPEVREHLRHSVKEPGDTAREALRNLTGLQF